MISVTKVEGNLFLCGRHAEARMHWSTTPQKAHASCVTCTRALARLALATNGLRARKKTDRERMAA
jgi:hypothetical protein